MEENKKPLKLIQEIRDSDLYGQLKKADDLLICLVAYLQFDEKFLNSPLGKDVLDFTNMKQYFKIVNREEK